MFVESVFLGFSYTGGGLIILGCGLYFELFSGCALMVLFVAAVCFLAWHPTTPHHMLSSHAGRYYARILSDRQFEYLSFCGRYGVVSSFIVLSDARLLFSGFRFMFLSCTLMLPDRSMGCGCYHPSPHKTSPSWDGFMREFRLWDDSNILRRYCVVYVFSRTFGTRVPFGSFLNFVFVDFSQSLGCVDRIYGCAGSLVRYKYNCDIIYLWASG